MILKNRLGEILEEKDISMYRVSEDLDIPYSTIHKVITNQTLDNTQLATINSISKYLDIEIKDSFSEISDDEFIIENNDLMAENMELVESFLEKDHTILSKEIKLLADNKSDDLDKDDEVVEYYTVKYIIDVLKKGKEEGVVEVYFSTDGFMYIDRLRQAYEIDGVVSSPHWDIEELIKNSVEDNSHEFPPRIREDVEYYLDDVKITIARVERRKLVGDGVISASNIRVLSRTEVYKNEDGEEITFTSSYDRK